MGSTKRQNVDHDITWWIFGAFGSRVFHRDRTWARSSMAPVLQVTSFALVNGISWITPLIWLWIRPVDGPGITKITRKMCSYWPLLASEDLTRSHHPMVVVLKFDPQDESGLRLSDNGGLILLYVIHNTLKWRFILSHIYNTPGWQCEWGKWWWTIDFWGTLFSEKNI